MPFSKEARLRLLKVINQVNWSLVKPSLFITLTYPDEYKDRTYETRTKDRYLFHRYVEKRLGKRIAALWRTEWQIRKSGELTGQPMPHVHMVLFSCPHIPWADVRTWWRVILGRIGPLATDVRRATDGEHAAKYIAKYVSKLDEISLDVAAYLNRMSGRSWGIKRPELLPWHRQEYLVDVPPLVVEEACRLAAEVWEGVDATTPAAFTLFTSTAAAIFERLGELAMATKKDHGYDCTYCEGERPAADDGHLE